MTTKSREVIWGGGVMGAKMRAETARKAAKEAIQKADRAEVEAWSIRWKVTAGLRSRRGRLVSALTAGWLAAGRMQSLQDEGEFTLDAIRRHAAMEAGGFAQMSIMPEGRYAPPVHMIKLTETREITLCRWVHPGGELASALIIPSIMDVLLKLVRDPQVFTDGLINNGTKQ